MIHDDIYQDVVHDDIYQETRHTSPLMHPCLFMSTHTHVQAESRSKHTGYEFWAQSLGAGHSDGDTVP